MWCISSRNAKNDTPHCQRRGRGTILALGHFVSPKRLNNRKTMTISTVDARSRASSRAASSGRAEGARAGGGVVTLPVAASTVSYTSTDKRLVPSPTLSLRRIRCVISKNAKRDTSSPTRRPQRHSCVRVVLSAPKIGDMRRASPPDASRMHFPLPRPSPRDTQRGGGNRRTAEPRRKPAPSPSADGKRKGKERLLVAGEELAQSRRGNRPGRSRTKAEMRRTVRFFFLETAAFPFPAPSLYPPCHGVVWLAGVAVAVPKWKSATATCEDDQP